MKKYSEKIFSDTDGTPLEAQITCDAEYAKDRLQSFENGNWPGVQSVSASGFSDDPVMLLVVYTEKYRRQKVSP